MQYRKNKDVIYIRIDKNDEITQTILTVCEKEKITAGHFQGIGACDIARLSTYIPQKADSIDHTISGMIEMVSLIGNISSDNENKPFLHAHATFSYLKNDGEISVTAGHLKEAQISYTGEVVLVKNEEKIGRVFDAQAGIDVWNLYPEN